MALFSRDDYTWMADAWATVINSTYNPDREVVIKACKQFAQLLAENSTGFDPVRFISNVEHARPTRKVKIS